MVYRIEVKPNSSFIDRIKANTLFGAFCYAYSSIVDDEKFKEELENVVFSDLFYVDGLPEKIVNGRVIYKKNNGITKDEVHNMIDRYNGHTQNVDGFYNIQTTFSASNMVFFMSTSITKHALDTVIDMMLLRGLGAKRSVGKGSFDLVDISEVELDYTKEKKVVALSDFIPDMETSTDIEEVKIICREGVTSNGELQKPLYLLSVGSVFKKENHQRETCGQLVYDDNSKTYIHAKAILYPVA